MGRSRPLDVPPGTTSVQTREALVAEARAHLLAHGWPRVQTSLILAGAGGAAFLASVTGLSAGLDNMGLRYGLAAVVGYLAFLGMIRVWIAWQRQAIGLDGLDLLVPDIGGVSSSGGDVSPGGSGAGHLLFAGGRSGGAGGGASFQPVTAQMVAGGRVPAATASGPSSGFSLGDVLSGDDAWPIVVALLFAAGGVLVIGYVIYAAPLLLAEVALDAALMGGLYKRLRKDEARHWSRGVVRSTCVPALLMVACAAGVGSFAQWAVPEARSIGGVVRTLMADADAEP